MKMNKTQSWNLNTNNNLPSLNITLALYKTVKPTKTTKKIIIRLFL